MARVIACDVAGCRSTAKVDRPRMFPLGWHVEEQVAPATAGDVAAVGLTAPAPPHGDVPLVAVRSFLVCSRHGRRMKPGAGELDGVWPHHGDDAPRARASRAC
jgi:hypothetical protein